MKLKLAVAAALLVGAIALLAGGTSASAEKSARSGVALEGYYSGRDAHGNHIRFNYRHGRMDNFRINHLDIGGANVTHARWSTSCTDAYFCSWGEWTASHEVKGAWNQGTHGGTARHFTVHWVHSHPG